MKDPNMNIKMIAHRTGFPNLSAFGKYVRKIYGMSPSEYRRKLIMN
jgi:AraC-like DNA-binding protein